MFRLQVKGIAVLALFVATSCGTNAIKIRGDSAVDEGLPVVQPDTSVVADSLVTTMDTTSPDLREVDALVTQDGYGGIDWADASGGGFEDGPSGAVQDAHLVDAPSAVDAAPHDVPPVYDIPGDLVLTREVYFTSDTAGLADLCIQTGGALTMDSCARPSSDFAGLCGSGRCGCSHYCDIVAGCSCPNGCFNSSYGCVGRAWAGCTVGMDQTCNDNSAQSSIHGRCVDGFYCQCSPYAINPTTGKCL